jgi:hypothetical protein
LRAAAPGHFAGPLPAPSNARNDGEARGGGALLVQPDGEQDWAGQRDGEKEFGWEWDEKRHGATDGPKEDFGGQGKG